MISSPLLIMVAQSTDIFLPIAQFGWASAISGVALRMTSSDAVRNGPPDAVSSTDLISAFFLREIHANGKCLAVNRKNLRTAAIHNISNQSAAAYKRFLIGKSDRYVIFQAKLKGAKRCHSDNSQNDNIRSLACFKKRLFSTACFRSSEDALLHSVQPADSSETRRKLSDLLSSNSVLVWQLMALSSSMLLYVLITSNVLFPIRPVEPSTATFFLLIFSPANQIIVR